MDRVDDGKTALPKPTTSLEEPGVAAKIARLDNTRYVFVMNDRELRQALMFITKPQAVPLVADDQKSRAYLLEVVRLLHNYLASAFTLVDHTRILAKDLYLSTDFWEEYEAKTKDMFDDSSLAQFVQRLRVYMLHRALPFTSLTLRMHAQPQSELDCFVNLDLARLRLWDGWNHGAREYLNRAEERVRLDELVAAYASLVTEFHDWFSTRQQDIHYGWLSDEGETTSRLTYTRPVDDNSPLLAATVTSISPLMVTAEGARTPVPAAKEPDATYALGDQVWLFVRTPLMPFIKGLQITQKAKQDGA